MQALVARLRAVSCVLLCAAVHAAAGAAWAADAAPARPLQEQVEALLRQQGLAPDRVALLLYSTGQRKYLAAVRHEQPLIAASNTKLVTTYIALRVLGPNFRWRTRLSLVEQNDGAGGTPRQGLLIEGGGDPTLTGRGLEAMALRLKAEGVRRIDGPIYLDGSLFEDDVNHNGLPPESPAYIPLSPFVVDGNAVEFTISRIRGGPPDVLSVLPADSVRIVSQLQEATEGRSLIKVEQGWSERGATFTLTGAVRRDPKIHTVSTSVSQPGPWFYQWFRVAMRRMGIEGNPPLQLGAPEGVAPRLVFTWQSPPLREAVVEIDKHSNNLGAEVMLRAVAQTAKPRGISGADGLKVVRRELSKDFPGMEDHYRMADGSGLSRNNQVSPLFLVRLLNRVLNEPSLRTEFLSALPVVGWDGTLRYRGASPEIGGRLRAKTGTLNGVSNLSGYLTTDEDLIVFSFLINDPTRPVEVSQAAQDQVIAGIYEALAAPQPEVAQAAQPTPPAAAPTQAEPAPAAPAAPAAAPVVAKTEAAPPAPVQKAEGSVAPPPPSPKPNRDKQQRSKS